jgi:PadR family transcriptional regulator PadR
MSPRHPSVTDSPFAPLGVLEEQIVVAVLRTREEAYGMQARRELERVTGREFSIGAVYSTLDRLEAKGLLTSSRVMDDGSSRRLFAVTPEGARALADTRSMRERLWRGVDVRELLALARA